MSQDVAGWVGIATVHAMYGSIDLIVRGIPRRHPRAIDLANGANERLVRVHSHPPLFSSIIGFLGGRARHRGSLAGFHLLSLGLARRVSAFGCLGDAFSIAGIGGLFSLDAFASEPVTLPPSLLCTFVTAKVAFLSSNMG